MKINNLIPKDILYFCSKKEVDYISNVLYDLGRFPNIHEIWELMDRAWRNLGCDPKIDDFRINEFYKHPVWLLNGIFTEQDPESKINRLNFCETILEVEPKRVADFGGGFGVLARLLAKDSPNITVELSDPYANDLISKYVEKHRNLKVVNNLSGFYDVIVAIDVLEHLHDPVEAVHSSSQHIGIGGHYLIANNFQPVILCHLPQLFHLNFSFDYIMESLGFQLTKSVKYGKLYKKIKNPNLKRARNIERISIISHPILKNINTFLFYIKKILSNGK